MNDRAAEERGFFDKRVFGFFPKEEWLWLKEQKQRKAKRNCGNLESHDYHSTVQIKRMIEGLIKKQSAWVKRIEKIKQEV